jgi:hypothetical protein
MSAQLYVTQVGLIKEAARHVWRALGEFAPEDTIFRLCASLKGDNDEPDEEDADLDGEEDGEESDEDFKPIDKSKLKKKSAGDEDDDDDEDDEEEDDDDDDDEEEEEDDDLDGGAVPFEAPVPGGEDGDEILLDAGGIFDQLLDDDPNASALASSFASSSLQDKEGDDAKKKKSKRQQRLQAKRDLLMQKLKELELLESYINQTAGKKVIGIRAVQELFDALLVTGQRLQASPADKKTHGKTEKALKEEELTLVRRAAQVIAKGLRNAGKGSTVCGFMTSEEWEEASEKLLASMQNVTIAPPQVAIEVGASFLYWLCSVTRAASVDKNSEDDGIGWDAARKILQKVLKEWSMRKDDIAVRCSPVILRVFAQRSPKLVLQLDWCKWIMEGRKPFVQREQVSFVIDRLLQDPKVLGAPGGSGAQFAESFGKLCIEFLENCKPANGRQVEGQQRKLQREALAGLAAALKALTKVKGTGGNAKVAIAEKSIVSRAIAAVNPVRDSLPNKRGELYQLCMQTLRLLGSSASQSPRLNNSSSPGSPKMVPLDGKRSAPQSPRGGPQKAPNSPKLGPKKKAPKVEKGTAQFFDSI